MTTAVTVPPAASPLRGQLVRIVAAGLAGGLPDMVYASGMAVAKGNGPFKVWQGVAAGWLGPSAREGGAATVALGLVTHYGIAICMAAAYAVAAAKLPVLYRRWLIAAPLYGVVLYLVMYRIVLPLRWPGAGGWKGLTSVLDICAHVAVAMAAVWMLQRSRRERCA